MVRATEQLQTLVQYALLKTSFQPPLKMLAKQEWRPETIASNCLEKQRNVPSRAVARMALLYSCPSLYCGDTSSKYGCCNALFAVMRHAGSNFSMEWSISFPWGHKLSFGNSGKTPSTFSPN